MPPKEKPFLQLEARQSREEKTATPRFASWLRMLIFFVFLSESSAR